MRSPTYRQSGGLVRTLCTLLVVGAVLSAHTAEAYAKSTWKMARGMKKAPAKKAPKNPGPTAVKKPTPAVAAGTRKAANRSQPPKVVAKPAARRTPAPTYVASSMNTEEPVILDFVVYRRRVVQRAR